MITNVINENHIIAFKESLKDVHTLKTMCVGNFNPLSNRSCETIQIAHKSLHTYNFVKNSNPILVVPIFKRKFTDDSVWESTLCGLSNHRLIDYVVDIRSINLISVIDRFFPDFVFVDRLMKTDSQFDLYAKKSRIKIVRV